MNDEKTAHMPLAGVRVVDISNYLAGPLSTMYLSDYGAEVVKIENPKGGDPMRLWGHNKNGVGLYYKMINRNKKSVTLDLRTPFGVEAVKKLVAEADVVVENYRTGVLEKWGLDYETLKEVNPAVIMLSITGFGRTGPYRNRPGFGSLAEAFAGFSHINGYADGPPLSPSWGLGDCSTGIAAAFLVMVALFERERRGGAGQQIDLAIYEQLLTMLGPQVIYYDQLGFIQGRSGSRLEFAVPRNNFQTKDGQWVLIAGSNQSIFENICKGLGREDLIADPRFANNRERMKNADAIEEELQKTLKTLTLGEVMERLTAFEGAATPINNVEMVVENEQVVARGNIAEVEDKELGGPVRMQEAFGKLSRTPGKVRHAGEPLGNSNREVLVEHLGYTEEKLRNEGIDLG